MKYQVIYKEPKNKKGYYSNQKATFLDITDALFWHDHVKKNGSIDIEVVPDFS